MTRVLSRLPSTLTFCLESQVKLTHDRDDLEAFFQPSVSKIINLLEEQILKANKAMPKGAKIGVSSFFSLT